MPYTVYAIFTDDADNDKKFIKAYLHKEKAENYINNMHESYSKYQNYVHDKNSFIQYNEQYIRNEVLIPPKIPKLKPYPDSTKIPIERRKMVLDNIDKHNKPLLDDYNLKMEQYKTKVNIIAYGNIESHNAKLLEKWHKDNGYIESEMNKLVKYHQYMEIIEIVVEDN